MDSNTVKWCIFMDKKIILQNILFPDNEICPEKEMYFHTDALILNNMISVEKNKSVCSDTYFNGFSIDKWREYTSLDSFFLDIRISGDLKLSIYENYISDGNIIKNKTGEHLCSSRNQRNFSFECMGRGIISFEIHAFDNSVLYGGTYSAYAEPEYVKIAAVICTYKREKFLERNIRILNNAFLKNPDSLLYDRLEIFIADNGQTLEADTADKNIHLFKNRNTGGSGGFARGMIEAFRLEKQKNLTHILLMDDDIVLYPETIYRTFILFSLVNDEYKDAFAGGSMIRLDRRFEQTESGALWNRGDIISLKYGYDLRNTENCIKNEINDNPQYQAWWYCGFPISAVNENNLPMPYFIRGDDVEYGLRNKKKLMLMNGICVWHETFENKYSSFLYYYIIRNELINNAIYHISFEPDEFKSYIKRKVMGEILVYRYRNAELILKAAEDFFKGTEFFKNTDGCKLHQDIINMGYKLENAENLTVKPDMKQLAKNLSENENTSLLYRTVRKLTINGHLLPCTKKTVTVPLSLVTHVSVFGAKTVCSYDSNGNTGFITEKSFKSAYRCMKKLRYIFRLCDEKYESTIKDFENNSHQLCTLSFWEKYLEI